VRRGRLPRGLRFGLRLGLRLGTPSVLHAYPPPPPCSPPGGLPSFTPPPSLPQVGDCVARGLEAVSLAHAAGVKMAFGR
jgi:hypothetical protein